MDFYSIKEVITKKNNIDIYPDFKTTRSKDLMVRGKTFYAIWCDERGLWSTDEYDVPILIDKSLDDYKDKIEDRVDGNINVKYLENFSSKSWIEYKKYVSTMSDNFKDLDNHLTFLNTKVKRKDYASKRLPYALQEGSINAWDEIIGTLYKPEERQKIEWAIGSIVAGDSRKIQKFIVFYGEPGSGKGTIIDIIQQLFEGYYGTFNAKALAGNNNQFATEAFKANPIVAIQHDGDLSKIEDNTKLNSITSHEMMSLNEKYKSTYSSTINSFLFMGTNKPVKITDAKSGIIRRLIDVSPSGKKIKINHYYTLTSQIEFELGAIAYHCLNVYKQMGKNYYADYKPINMMLKTDVFFNFVDENYFIFKDANGVTLKQAYDMYKIYCDEVLVQYKLAKYKFREELKNYFETFHDVIRIDGKQVRSYYSGFLSNKLASIKTVEEVEEHPYSLVLDKKESLLDELYIDSPAQYATKKQTPKEKWDEVKTTLKDIDTKKMHYLKLPLNHIVIDFDLKNDNGDKSLELNIDAASKWPPTYSEISKGGNGIHLHYIYEGDVELLSRLYDKDIEVKVFVGKSSLRRKLTRCNNTKIATINSGLPMKGEKMINFEGVKNENILRALIEKNLRKEVHPSTKPSIDFIYKILEDVYHSDLKYDVTDLAQHILVFASNSSHQSDYCLQIVNKMHFKSEEISKGSTNYISEDLIFFDVEVYPNLFLIVWKKRGTNTKVRMYNPTPADVEQLMRHKLIGHNVRRYDNHILYARYIGYTNEQLFKLSQRIINNDKNAYFGEAYNISYADTYDYPTKKQSLKKWEIELGIKHLEMDLPWDEPVSKDKWDLIGEYCETDVDGAEGVFDATEADFIARKILADLSGLTPNDTTQRHAAKIIFGNERNPQSKFVYTDLSEEFPDYKYVRGKSTYKDMDISEGGQVYSKPGIYGNVGLFDIASMHPTSLRILNHFGPYTARFGDLVDARLAIKHKKFDKARNMLGGILKKYLINAEENPELTKSISYALKIIINIVYGMTSAKFINVFKDPRNKDNIVAKRGALFMVDLLKACEEKGYEAIHIKTDSIKIADTTPEIAEFIMQFGEKYGYTFEHEATYDKIALVNDAVYIAKDAEDGHWTATGAQFAHPYVYKKLFSGEPIEFKDLCETKAVTTKMYLDFNETLINGDEKQLLRKVKEMTTKINKAYARSIEHEDYLSEQEYKELKNEVDIINKQLYSQHDYNFIGKVGLFCPIKEGNNAGLLMRKKDDKYHAVTGTKGYRWMEADNVEANNMQDEIDYTYFGSLIDSAIKNISKYGDFEWFRSEDKYSINKNEIYPF